MTTANFVLNVTCTGIIIKIGSSITMNSVKTSTGEIAAQTTNLQNFSSIPLI